jgi:hypothetical protein
MVPAWVVKVAISASVVWSFVQANLGAPGALRLWLEGWEGILVYMSVGLGLSWAKDLIQNHVDARVAQQVPGAEGGQQP